MTRFNIRHAFFALTLTALLGAAGSVLFTAATPQEAEAAEWRTWYFSFCCTYTDYDWNQTHVVKQGSVQHDTSRTATPDGRGDAFDMEKQRLCRTQVGVWTDVSMSDFHASFDAVEGHSAQCLYW
jgi:hypothetical protein